jgi:hypothetical protein
MYAMEGRIARLEGAFEQTNERLAGIERRLDRIEHALDLKFMWVIGIVVGTWITTILAVLFHR